MFFFSEIFNITQKYTFTCNLFRGNGSNRKVFRITNFWKNTYVYHLNQYKSLAKKLARSIFRQRKTQFQKVQVLNDGTTL